MLILFALFFRHCCLTHKYILLQMGTWNDEPKSGTVNYGKGVVYKQPPDTSQYYIVCIEHQLLLFEP